MPNWQQAIIWTNDVLSCRRIYELLCLNELNPEVEKHGSQLSYVMSFPRSREAN